MRILAYFLVVVCLAGGVWAKPVLDKSDEARAYLLEQKDVPILKMNYLKPSRWLISSGKEGYRYVDSVRQRWWRSIDRTEILVEAGIFPSRQDALQAAEFRVKELKMRKGLQDQMLKGGQLPGQAKGDRVWGLLDPPEPDKPEDRCHNIGPMSRFAAVVFVKKEVCIEVTAESMATNVDLGDLEQLAKKIAVKIKPANEPPGQKDKKK